jgi:hypothetical protein
LGVGERREDEHGCCRQESNRPRCPSDMRPIISASAAQVARPSSKPDLVRYFHCAYHVQVVGS